MAKVKLNKIFITIFGFLITIGFIGFILHIFLKVKSGHGLEYYRTGHGVEMIYIGVLIAIGIIPIVLILGWLGNKIFNLKENYLISKYNKKKKRRK